MTVWLSDKNCAYVFRLSPICAASSRVGARMSARGQPLLGRRGSLASCCSSGSVNAAVLPVPVCALPIRSRPSSRWGMHSAWIGVGSQYPWAPTACCSSGIKEPNVPRGRPLNSGRFLFGTERVCGRASDSKRGSRDSNRELAFLEFRWLRGFFDFRVLPLPDLETPCPRRARGACAFDFIFSWSGVFKTLCPPDAWKRTSRMHSAKAMPTSRPLTWIGMYSHFADRIVRAKTS